MTHISALPAIFDTPVTRTYGIRLPVVAGGLQWLANAEYVSAAAGAGIISFITAASFAEMDDLRTEIRRCREMCDGKPFGVNVSMIPKLVPGEKTEEVFRLIADEGVQFVETSGRSPEAFMPILKDAGITVLHKVPSGPDRGTVPAALRWYDSRISDLSSGDLRLDIQWGGALFKESAAVQGIGDGVADAGSIIAAYFQKEMAAYSLADFPIGGANAWIAMRATDRLMRSDPQIADHLAQQNLVYIGTFTASAVNVACTGAPIRTVEDIKGKKVRGAGVYGKVFGELGATPVNLSVYEAYQGLDTGLIDCSQGYDYIVPSLKWDEVIDSYTVLNWGQIGGYGMFMNKQVFDSLNADQQKVLKQAGEELADEFAKIVTSANGKAMDAMTAGKTARKVEVIELGEADIATLNAAAEPFIAEWMENARSAGFDADRLMATYTAAVAEYTAEFEAQGYPWTRNN